MSDLIFSSEFPPGPGGIGAHAYNLTRQLITHSHQVVVYTADRSDYPSRDFDLTQHSTIIRYSAHTGRLRRFGHLVNHVWKYRKGCDWIILSGLSNLALYSLISIIIKARVLCVVHGHEIIMAKGINRFLVRRAIFRADCVVAVSEFSKRILRENGIGRSVITIPNGVNLTEGIKIRKRDQSKLVLITVGSVTKRKGQQNVIAALPDLLVKYANIEYHIIGIPREQNEIELLADNLGVTRNVIFHGAVSDEEKKRLLNQADVFMLLSENLPDGDVEGFGIAVLEANGFGLPALGSRGTGVEQAISEGESGCLVDAKDPKQICKCIDVILENYDRLSEGAYLWAQKHDWSIIGKYYLALLEKNKK